MPNHEALVPTICETLVHLAQELQTAMRTANIAAFQQIITQREPLVNHCLAAWDQLAEGQRQLLAPLLRATLVLDATTLELAETWLRQARQQFSRLKVGATTLQHYQAPLVQLTASRRLELHA